MKRNGFTLIELLVVIVIVCLLGSIILSALREKRHKAEKKHIESCNVKINDQCIK